MQRVFDKVIIVTGGAGGIGSASVRLLAAEGGRVLFCDVDSKSGTSLESELKLSGYDVSFTEADVRDIDANRRLVETAIRRYGRLDAVVCCAGRQSLNAFADYEPAEWSDAFEVNCSAGFYMSKYAIPAMRVSGGGSIVFLGDGCMDMPLAKMGCDLSAKMALFYLCRQIGVESCRDNIRANIVSPTLVRSSHWRDPASLKMVEHCANSRHSFLPEDIAPIILFMVSDESRMISASNIKANDNFDCGFDYDMWAGMPR